MHSARTRSGPLLLAATVGTLLVGTALAACSSSSSGPASSATASSSPVPSASSSAGTTPASPLPPITALTPPGAVAQQVPGAPDWLVVAEGSAWGAGTAGLVRLDGRSGIPVGTLPVGGPVCQAMDVGYAAIWLATCETPTLVRIDPVRHRVSARIPLPITGVQEESSVAAGSGTFGVWVLSDDTQHIVRVDPGTNRVAATLAVPYGSTAARAGFGSLWLTNSGDSTLVRVDPRDGTVLATIPVGAGPRFLAVGDTGVFTLDQAGARSPTSIRRPTPWSPP